MVEPTGAGFTNSGPSNNPVRLSEPVTNPVVVDNPLNSALNYSSPGVTTVVVRPSVPLINGESLPQTATVQLGAQPPGQAFLPNNPVPHTWDNSPSYVLPGLTLPKPSIPSRAKILQALTNSAKTTTDLGFVEDTGTGLGNGGGYGIGVGSGTTGSGGLGSGSKANNGFAPNPLDAYANYTYHLKLWATSQDNEILVKEAVSAPGDTKLAIDRIPKVIIAESGVTEGFGIKEFSFVNLVGTNQESRNSQDQTWSMVIMEPYGLSLPDKINSAAQQYGMLNWQRAKYYLQMYFVGYNEDGTPVGTALFHKVFCLMIMNISLTASESGSVYDIKGIMDGGYGLSNETAINKCVVKIVDKSTVEQSIKDLQNALNENVKKVELTNIPTISYEIIIPNVIKSWKIDSGKVYTNDSRSWHMDIAGGAKPAITLTAGTDIGESIRYIISRSPDAVSWETGQNAAQGNSSFASHGILKNLKIHSQVTYTDFDFYTGDYIKKITYTVYPYEETRIATNINQVRQASDANVQQAKLDYLFRIGRIKKRYDWIYTGQNLDVIKFDLKINNFWAIAVPQYGAQNTVSNQTMGPTVDKNTSLYIQTKTQMLEDAKKRLANAQAKKNASVGNLENITGFWAHLGQAAALAVAAEAGGQALYQTQSLIEQELNAATARVALAEQDLQAAKAQTSAARTGPFVVPINHNPSNLTSNPYAQKVLAGRDQLQAAAKKGRVLFAEDQSILAMDPEFPITTKYLPEANMSEGNQATASSTSEGNQPGAEPPSRTLLGTYHGNLSSFNKENINIILDIRGDPYWIGYDNLTQNYQLTNPSEARTDFADYLGGDNMFYFTYRTGQAPNESSGFMQFDNTSQTVAGYYIVMRVTNTFREGAFTQQLQSIKDLFSQKASSKNPTVSVADFSHLDYVAPPGVLANVVKTSTNANGSINVFGGAG